jgi:hypothetical protein
MVLHHVWESAVNPTEVAAAPFKPRLLHHLPRLDELPQTASSTLWLVKVGDHCVFGLTKFLRKARRA